MVQECAMNSLAHVVIPSEGKRYVAHSTTDVCIRKVSTNPLCGSEKIERVVSVFFNTGWGSLWMKNNDRYGGGEPGPGLEAAAWLIDKGVCVVGADSWGVEAVPNPDKNLAFPVHGELITKNGIFIHENLVFDALIADRKYQFVYVFAPAPVRGATGSNGNPIALT